MRLPVSKTLYRILGLFGAPVAWEVSAGAVLFRVRNGKREYLLLRYPSGHFEFPRGHIEAGETEEETARREVSEETGLAEFEMYPHRISFSFFYVAKGNERQKRLAAGRGLWIFKQAHVFPALASSDVSVRLSEEHTEYLWLPYPDALATATFENARQVLRETERYLDSREPLSDTRV